MQYPDDSEPTAKPGMEAHSNRSEAAQRGAPPYRTARLMPHEAASSGQAKPSPAPISGKPMARMSPRVESPPADPRDQSGNRLLGRRQVGPADSKTASQMLDEALKGSPPPKSAPQPAKAPSQGGTGDATGIGGREWDAANDAAVKAAGG